MLDDSQSKDSWKIYIDKLFEKKSLNFTCPTLNFCACHNDTYFGKYYILDFKAGTMFNSLLLFPVFTHDMYLLSQVILGEKGGVKRSKVGLEGKKMVQWW